MSSSLQSGRSEGLQSLQQKTSLHNVGSPIAHAEGVDIEAFERLVAGGDSLPYLTYLL